MRTKFDGEAKKKKAESLGQMLEELGRQSKEQGCQAAICYNKDDKEAKAADHIVSIHFCGSKDFIWSKDDNARICQRCLTPQVKETQRVVGTKIA